MRQRWDRLRAGSSDEGFSLVEVMTALVIFALVSGALLALVMRGAQTIRGNADRVLAASLARSELDAWLAVGANGVPLGQTSRTVVNQAGTFTISTTATWIDLALGTNPCKVGPGVDPGRSYVRVHIEVTGGELGAPQLADGLVYPQETAPKERTGTVTVQVSDNVGAPLPGVTVSLTGGSPTSFTQVTGGDGCVFFPDVPASTLWTVSIDRAGYITEEPGGQVAPGTVVTELQNTQKLFVYAMPGTLTFTAGTADFPIPPGIPFTFNPDKRGLQPKTFTTYPVVINGLWPTLYNGQLGICQLALQLGSVSTTVDPGGSGAMPLVGGQVEIVAPQDTMITVSSAEVDATSPSGLCQSGPYTIGTVDESLRLTATLPYGNWRFTASGPRMAANSPGEQDRYLHPLQSPCSVSWRVPGAIYPGETSAPSPTPSDSGGPFPTAPPQPSPSLILPVVSAPCPTELPTPTASPAP
jgi:prepilin-type N-terminal cleavage/methylation domain-containing protein